MTKLVTGDGRTHIESALMRESLVDRRVIATTDSVNEFAILPDVDPGWAYEVAAAESPTGRVMVEAFIAGPQVSTESVVVQGRTHTVGFSDRNYELLDRFAPYVIAESRRKRELG